MTQTEIIIIAAVAAIKILVGLTLWFFRNMHKEGIGELKEIKRDIGAVKTDIHGLIVNKEVSHLKFEEGVKEFAYIAEQDRLQDAKIDKNTEHCIGLDKRVQRLEIINEKE